MSISHKCCVCPGEFPPDKLDKDGKCPSCRVEYPTAKSLEDVLKLNQPELTLGKKLDEKRVRQIVREEMNLVKAEKKAEALNKAREAKAKKGDK